MNPNDNTFRVEKAEESSGFLLWQVTTLWQREIKKVLEEYGLTHPQFVLMTSIHWLTLHKKEVTQVLLSTHTQIEPMTISTTLRTLQQREYLQRQEHTTDTRAKTVTLTPKGIELIKKAVVAVEQLDVNFFGRLDCQPKIFNEYLRSLLVQE